MGCLWRKPLYLLRGLLKTAAAVWQPEIISLNVYSRQNMARRIYRFLNNRFQPTFASLGIGSNRRQDHNGAINCYAHQPSAAENRIES